MSSVFEYKTDIICQTIQKTYVLDMCDLGLLTQMLSLGFSAFNITRHIALHWVRNIAQPSLKLGRALLSI